MEFLHQLQSGDLGARLIFQRLWSASKRPRTRRSSAIPSGAWPGRSPSSPSASICATRPSSALRADLEGEARAAFEGTWSALAGDATLTARPPMRTADPAWSPVVLLDRPLVGDAPVLRVIHRMSYEPGHELLVGRVLAPTAHGVLSIAASNLSRATGYRESARVMAALESRDGADAEAVTRELGQAGLDDATYDLLFPDHPLSLVRAALAWLLDAEGGDLAVTSPASAEAEAEVELAAPGCAITPPPRYLPLLAGAVLLSPTRAMLTRVGLAVTTPRALDIWRIEGASILGPDREKQLARLARKNAAEWADEGATDVTSKITKLPSKDGRAHVQSRVRFTTPAGPTQSAARWMADTDGAVFRVAASGEPGSRRLVARGRRAGVELPPSLRSAGPAARAADSGRRETQTHVVALQLNASSYEDNRTHPGGSPFSSLHADSVPRVPLCPGPLTAPAARRARALVRQGRAGAREPRPGRVVQVDSVSLQHRSLQLRLLVGGPRGLQSAVARR